MTSREDGSLKPALKDLMDSNGFTANTMFYRETLTEYLTPVDGGAYRISANEDPSEAVIDVYSQGHMTLARTSLIAASLSSPIDFR